MPLLTVSKNTASGATPDTRFTATFSVTVPFVVVTGVVLHAVTELIPEILEGILEVPSLPLAPLPQPPRQNAAISAVRKTLFFDLITAIAMPDMLNVPRLSCCSKQARLRNEKLLRAAPAKSAG